MVDIFYDKEKPFLPMLVSNWIFGIGIAQYPIGVPHRVLSFTYSLLNITLYCVVAFFAYPYYLEIIDVTNSTATTMIFLFCISILLTIIMITSGWSQAKVRHLSFFKKISAKSIYKFEFSCTGCT